MMDDCWGENGIQESAEFAKTYMNVTIMRKCTVCLSLDSLNYPGVWQVTGSHHPS